LIAQRGDEGRELARILAEVASAVVRRLQGIGELLDQAQAMTAEGTPAAARVTQLQTELGLGPPPSRPEPLPFEAPEDPASSLALFVTWVSSFRWPELGEIATRYRRGGGVYSAGLSSKSHGRIPMPSERGRFSLTFHCGGLMANETRTRFPYAAMIPKAHAA
jgi:hypothetical protein